MKTARPLTASLHTVTAVSRVALALQSAGVAQYARRAEVEAELVSHALIVLGYTTEAAEAISQTGEPASDLILRCIAATRALIAGGAK